MPPRFPVRVLGLSALFLAGCKPPAPQADEPAGGAADAVLPPAEVPAGPDFNLDRLHAAERHAREAPFPLAALLAGEQPALRAALAEQPWLDADAFIAALAGAAAPTYGGLLQAFALQGETCTWRAWPLPVDNPFAATADQVSCLIPMERVAAIGSDDRPTGETRVHGPEYIFLVAADGGSVTLLSIDGDPVVQEALSDRVSPAFQLDLVLARLAVSWLIGTDPAWRERDAQGAGHSGAGPAGQPAGAGRGEQFLPVVAAIGRWMDLNHGDRPRRLEDLGRHGLGLISSPSLLHWKGDDGSLSAEPMLYFPRPLLLADHGLAVLLAAPAANPDGTRSVAASSGRTADIPDADFRAALDRRESR